MDQDKPPAPEQPAVKAEPALSPQKQAQKQRLAEALRANLRRRKAQVRGRKAEPGGDTGP
jgi:hypothetical protein